MNGSCFHLIYCSKYWNVKIKRRFFAKGPGKRVKFTESQNYPSQNYPEKNVDFLKDFDGTEESGQIYGESKLSGVKIKRSQLYPKTASNIPILMFDVEDAISSPGLLFPLMPSFF